MMKKYKKHKLLTLIYISIIMVISWICFGLFRGNGDYEFGFTLSLSVTVSILFLITLTDYLKINNSKEKATDSFIKDTDERTVYLTDKALVLTYRLTVLIVAVMCIYFSVSGNKDSAVLLANILSASLIIYLIVYIYYKKKI